MDFFHDTTIIEGFGGKKAFGILLKSNLYQKCSKFCNPCSFVFVYVFLLKFASFSKYYIHECKKPVFVVTSACNCKDGNFHLKPSKILIF